MKKVFFVPTAEVIRFGVQDIVTASSNSCKSFVNLGDEGANCTSKNYGSSTNDEVF